MNLFESKIAEITTSDNASYMEAVSKIFNILFEDQINQAGIQSAENRQKLGAYVAELIQAADAVLSSSDYFSQNIKPEKVSALKAIIKSTPEQKSDYAFYNEIKSIVLGDDWRGEDGMIDDAIISSVADTKENMKRLGISPEALHTFIKYKEVLNDFVDKKIPQFNKTTAPSMFTRPPRVRTNKASTNAANVATEQPTMVSAEQPTTATASEEQPINPVTEPAGTKATPKTPKASKPPKTPSKPEPQPVPEVKASRDFIDAQILENDDSQSISFDNVPDATSLANALKSNWNTILQAKGRYNLHSNGIEIIDDPNSGAVKMTVTVVGSDMGVINRHMVAMYCLYMDAKKRGLVSKENTYISEPVANILAIDNENGKSILSRLSGFFETSTYELLTKPEINDIINVLRKDGMTDDYNATLASAIVASIEPLGPADVERYNALLNDRRDPTHAKLEKLVNTFNNSIAQVVDNMMPASDAEPDGNAPDTQKEVIDVLNKCNIYEYVMNFMSDKSKGKAKKTTNDFSYNELAENVVTFCKNDLRQNNNELGNRYSSQAEFDTSMDDLRSAVDDLSATEQYEPQTTAAAADKKFRVAR